MRIFGITPIIYTVCPSRSSNSWNSIAFLKITYCTNNIVKKLRSYIFYRRLNWKKILQVEINKRKKFFNIYGRWSRKVVLVFIWPGTWWYKLRYGEREITRRCMPRNWNRTVHEQTTNDELIRALKCIMH